MKLVGEALEIVTRVPAYFAESARGRVFALAPDRSSVSAFELATGKESWRTPLDGELPIEMVPSFGPRKRLLLHGQWDLFVVDEESGALVKKSEGGWSKAYIEERNGACLMGNPCSVRFIDCEDGSPYGPVLTIAVTHIYAKIGLPHDNVCWGPLLVLGRSNNLVVAVTDGRTWDQKEDAITLAFDATTGKTVWSSRAHGARFLASEASGMASDVCWIGDVDGKLDVFDCSTGQARFATKVEKATEQPKFFVTWTGGLFVSAKRASLLDPKTGTARWSIDLPPDGLALPVGVPLELPKFSTWGAHTVLLVDPKSGKELARFSQPEYTEIVQAEDLGLGLAKGPSFDAHGVKRETKEKTFAIDREHLPRSLKVKDAPVLEVSTDLALVAQSENRVALFVWGPKGKSGSLVIAKLR